MTQLGESVRLKASRCPACGELTDAAACVDGEGSPGPGALTVCLYCGGFNQYGSDLQLQPLSEDRFSQLPIDVRKQLLRVREAILDLKVPPRRRKDST